MKRLLIIIIVFSALKANAQTYLISFAGTGASATVSSVIVENLTAGSSTTLSSGQILRLTIITGVNSTENRQSDELKIYPNPMTDNSILQLYPPVAGIATITVSDMNGKRVAQIQSYLEKNLQEFRLSGINSGLYLITVKGSTYQFTGRLLSNSKAAGKVRIEKISSNKVVVGESLKTDNKGTKSNMDLPPYVDMAYTSGGRIKFTGISGNYSTVKTDIPASDETITFNFIACTDGDNINYPVVEIGTQIWMAENLKTTKYSNGDLIGTTDPATKDITTESTPGYQWAYDSIDSNVSAYGRLYTWYAVTDSRNVCPTGWHVSTDAEWHTLALYLDASAVLGDIESYSAGGKLKETGITHWITPNVGASNESGFTAPPGGYRDPGGSFLSIDFHGYWWNSEADGSNHIMSYLYSNLYRGSGDKKLGFSVRCIKD